MEKTIASNEIGSLSPEDESLMKRGQELADKFDLIFNGWWEKFFTFTTKKGKYSFAANNEDEIKQKLMQYESTNLLEMPHVATKNVLYDFKMEKPGWPERLAKEIRLVGINKLPELLAPFYGIYKRLFEIKFNEISDKEKELLRHVLPPQFLKDMGVN